MPDSSRNDYRSRLFDEVRVCIDAVGFPGEPARTPERFANCPNKLIEQSCDPLKCLLVVAEQDKASGNEHALSNGRFNLLEALNNLVVYLNMPESKEPTLEEADTISTAIGIVSLYPDFLPTGQADLRELIYGMSDD